MTKIDNSFMEKLEEVLYDENKAINYKMVSIMFGVHVNIAKQMLYHFYTTKKTEAKKIHAMYYLSGMVTWKTLCSMSSSMGNWDGEENKKKVPESESYLVLLCKDTDLEEYKSKFSRLFSVHVYSLSSFPLENYDVLERLVEEPLVDSEGRTPLDFGPIVCSESEKLLEGIPIVETKAAPVRETVKKPEKETSSANSKGNKESGSKEAVAEDTKKSSGQKAVIAPPGEKNGANRLKNMFATAAAKPKPKPKEDKVEDKPEPKAKEVPKQSSKSASSKSKSEANGKSKNSETRKRKRIRDVLSSSESEDEKKSDDEEEGLPESPIPRKKRIQIESDSDDDDFKEAPKPKKEEVLKAGTTDKNKPAVPGRRRVVKMVSETRMSDDGFMVTEKKQVMVSEDEDAEGESESKTASTKSNKPAPVPQAKKADPKPAKPVSSSKPSSGKTKQPSVMSFFQKK